jgi:transcriptional adapter 2-alpha
MNGLGNWKAVSEYLGTKTPAKCESHYHGVYLNSKTAPLPDIDGPVLAPEEYGIDNTDYTSFEPSSYNPKLSKSKYFPLAELAGYIPKRAEFATEWNNDLEKLICDIEFSPDDTPLMRNLKFKVIEVYNRILDGRYERKAFVIDRALMNEGPYSIVLGTEDHNHELLSFMRFYSNLEDFQVFMSRLNREMRLRKSLERLIDYRKKGIRTPTEEHYFLEALRMKQLPEPLQSESAPIHGSDFSPLLERLPKKENSLDVHYLEGCELLTKQELELCSEVIMLPRQYLFIKFSILQEAYFKGAISKDTAAELFPKFLEASAIAKVFDLMVNSGWINPASSSNAQQAKSVARSLNF